MTHQTSEHHFDTVVVGGGQAGLAVGYYLARQDRDFVILDAESRVGDVWRSRWDSLRLFTPARYSGLPGMPFPAEGGYFPTKDEMADYLEVYAARFDLPVWPGVRVDMLTREEDHYLLTSGNDRLKPKDIVAAGVERVPRTAGVRDGRPVLEDGRVPDVANVVWCTGFAPDFRWIELPVFGEDGYPVHYRGVVGGEPGLYFVGLPFLYSLTSSLIGGVGRDAEYVSEHIAARSPTRPARWRGDPLPMDAEQKV